jgi:hypothetical protein
LHLTETFPRLLAFGQQTVLPPQGAETEMEVSTVENIKPTYVCSPSALFAVTGTAYGHGRTSGVINLAPISLTTQGTGVSIAAMRDKAAAQATARTTALLPISDVVDTFGFVGLAGIRSWSPPV